MRIVVKIKIIFLTILIMLAVSANCHAEIANNSSAIKATAPQEVRFTHLTSKNGLSSDSVIGVAQDDRGFMWFTTLQGLNRYDGYDFKVYKNDPENPNSLSGDSLRELFIDRTGLIWIGTWENGLNKFDPVTEQFTRYQHDPNNVNSLSHDSVREVYVDRQGVVWVGVLNGGLNRLNPENDQFIHYRHDPDDPHSLSDNGVFAIYEDRAGVLWVGTQKGGLNKFDRETEQFITYKHDPNDPHSLSLNSIRSIYEDREGVLWIATNGGGLNQFDRETEKFIRYQHDPDDPHSLSNDVLWPIYEDRGGRLWIGTRGGGLNRFDRETKKFVHYRQNLALSNSMNNNHILSIFEDQVGNLWVATLGGGVNILDRQRKHFYHYHNVPGDHNSLSGNDVRAICEDRTGALWLGTLGSGLNKFERKTGQFTRYYYEPDNSYSLSSNSIWAILEDRQGLLWISTNKGLNKYDPKTDRFTRYLYDPENPRGLSTHHVYKVIEDQQGILWMGTNGGGLNKFDRNTEQFTHYLHDPEDPQSLSSNSLWVTYEDRAGELWVGTWGGGLNKFDRETEKFIRYQHDSENSHSLSHNSVFSIYEDRRGILWIGTFDGGLNKFDRDNGRFTHYTKKDGLPSNTIWGILEDDQGNLWLSTSQGLSKFNYKTETFRNYDTGDGLQGNQFNTLSYYKSSGGEMFFGGTNGVTAFYPDDIRDNPHIAPIVVTNFKVNNKPVEIKGDSILQQSIAYTNALTLSYKSRVISFEFAALNYTSSQKNQYKYRLEGFDEDWIDIESDMRFVTYTNLGPGNYVFRVTGSNNDGIWNENGRSIKIIMTPPWWKTLWFRGFVVVLIAAGLFGALRLRTRSLKTRSRELENQVAKRTKELTQAKEELVKILGELEGRVEKRTAQLSDLVDKLREAEVRYRTVADFTYDWEYWQNPDGNFNYISPACKRVTGYSAEEFTDNPKLLDQIIVPEDRTIWSNHRQGALEESKPKEVQFRIHRKNGEICWIEHACQQVLDDQGEYLGFRASNRDITARKHSEEALKASREESRLLAGKLITTQEAERARLARELHDDITQRLAFLNIEMDKLEIQDQSLSEPGKKRLRQIGDDLGELSSDIHMISRQLHPSILDDLGLTQAIETECKNFTRLREIPITLDLDGTLQDLSKDICLCIYRILQEGLRNVAKHAKATDVQVMLSRKDDTVHFMVKDNGKGFDPASNKKSVGLGMASMAERARLIQGDLSIESRPGQGTVIKLKAPFASR